MSDLQAAFRQIEVLSNTLNQSSDLLSQKIVEIESSLNQYKLGIWAWLDKPLFSHLEEDGNGGEYEVSVFLGYGKLRDKWGFLAHQRVDEDPETCNPVFLKDAPRDTRVVAIDHIPDLIQCIAQKASALSQEVAKKTKVAEQIVASLKKSK